MRTKEAKETCARCMEPAMGYIPTNLHQIYVCQAHYHEAIARCFFVMRIEGENEADATAHFLRRVMLKHRRLRGRLRLLYDPRENIEELNDEQQ